DAVRIAVRADSPIAGFGDLAGKRVAVVAATTVEGLVARLAKERNVSFTTVPVRNNLRGVQALEDGRVDAYIAAAALILGELSRSADPSRYRVVGDPLLVEPYACVLPKGDTAFKALVDGVLKDMMANGDMAELHRRWFEAPIPPYQRALNLPLNDATRAAFASPNDRPLP
ncbi:MAG TPA: transporter substrate-binding domain-containing protein, partial [Pelomicrobium sp.]|nr:transporter substrate-binding domain-containing protein [Pelomicrobium sp.]